MYNRDRSFPDQDYSYDIFKVRDNPAVKHIAKTKIKLQEMIEDNQ